MSKKIKYIVATTVPALALGVGSASAQEEYATEAETLITDTVQEVGTTIFNVLGPILGLAGVLIALFFGFKQLRRWVGGSRG